MVEAFWLGSVPYRQAWALQARLVREVAGGHRPDTLLLLDHPHVFTFGRRGSLANLLWDEAELQRRGVEVVWCDRGGDVTYHGPGQLVGYPILDLRRHGGDIHAYLRRLEASLIAYVGDLGIAAGTVTDLTGVWTGQATPAKVAAIGVKLTGPVTSHGFGLNLTTDLEYFAGIVPCGLAGHPVASVASVVGQAPTTTDAALGYPRRFAQAFDVELRWGARSMLAGALAAADVAAAALDDRGDPAGPPVLRVV